MSTTLLNELATVFEETMSEYMSLWSFKELGKSIEISTCHSTVTNKFVSVFLTKRENGYVVTDGGLINNNDYVGDDFYIDSNCFNRAFAYVQGHYKIKQIEDSIGNSLYYKVAAEPQMVASVIHDMCSFIVQAVNLSASLYEEPEEHRGVRIFTQEANHFLKNAFSDKVDFKQKVLSGSSIQFSAVVRTSKHIHLINYITGSNREHFVNSINRANMNFQAVHKIYGSQKSALGKLVGFIDDTSAGSKQGGYKVQYDILGTHSNSLVRWTEKEQLAEMLL
jgi:hypothetical protein